MENLSEFIVNHWILTTAFVILAWLVFSDAINRKLSGLKTLTANEAIRLVNQHKGRFVDVRDPAEFAVEHIAESINVPVATLDDDNKSLKKTSQPLVVVCASGQRARGAAKQLQKKGFEEVYVLNGGLQAWKTDKLPLVS